jgi:hypothetical protein
MTLTIRPFPFALLLITVLLLVAFRPASKPQAGTKAPPPAAVVSKLRQSCFAKGQEYLNEQQSGIH